MTVVPRRVPSDCAQPAVTPLPEPGPRTRPDPALLIVTASPAPPGAVVIAARGEVDLNTGPLLQDQLHAHLHDTGRRLIVDLTEVSFFGAAGLAILVTARNAAMAAGITLCLVAHTRTVLMPLKITGLDGVFDIYPHLVHALLRTRDGGVSATSPRT